MQFFAQKAWKALPVSPYSIQTFCRKTVSEQHHSKSGHCCLPLWVNRSHMSFCTFHSNNSCICNICDARGSVYKGGCSPYPRKKGSLLSSNTLMDLLSLKYKWNLYVSEHFSNDCGKYLAIVIGTLCDWLKKPEPDFQSVRSKTWQNQSQLVHVIFPAF